MPQTRPGQRLKLSGAFVVALSVLLLSVPACMTQDPLVVTTPSSGAPLPGQLPSSSQPTGLVTLSWSANAGEQQGFYLEQSSNNGATYTVIQTLPDGTTTATVSSLYTGKSYNFRVRGYNATGTSPYTAVMTATIPSH